MVKMKLGKLKLFKKDIAHIPTGLLSPRKHTVQVSQKSNAGTELVATLVAAAEPSGICESQLFDSTAAVRGGTPPVDNFTTAADTKASSSEPDCQTEEEQIRGELDDDNTASVDERQTFDDEYTDEESEHTFESAPSTLSDQTEATYETRPSVVTSKGSEVDKKYFHKDVVLNSLDHGMESLVIRAMYFIPKPKEEDHVIIKVEASTISARDCLGCRAITKDMLPFVPGYEIVGTVQSVGSKAESEGVFRKGDRVCCVSTFGGGNSRFVSTPTSRLMKIPEDVKSTHAVCMVHDYMAALKALRLAKKINSPAFTGMNILITDGYSPVGQAIITLASMEGANIYCCADESKHSYLLGMGVKCFTKNPDDWLESAAGTFDVVIDNSCIDSYVSSSKALNTKGYLVCLGPVYYVDQEDTIIPHSGCGLVIDDLQQKWGELKAKYLMSRTSFLNTITYFDDDTEQYKQDLRYVF